MKEKYQKLSINYKIQIFQSKKLQNRCFRWRVIYRCHHSTTTDLARDRAIENSKSIFLKSQYPLYLLEQKITEVRKRNFQKSDYAEKRRADLENPDFEQYTLCLTYTSLRCSNVATSIHKIMNHPTLDLHPTLD